MATSRFVGLHSLAGHVRAEGEVVRTGRERVREVLNASLTLSRGVPLIQRPGINSFLGLMMGASILTGIDNPQMMESCARGLDAKIPWAKWDVGRRSGIQLEKLVEELKASSQSRRATLILARSSDEVPPCETGAQFLQRKHTLHVVVTMRSWDVIRYGPHDLVAWGLVGQVVQNVLSLPKLSLTFNAASAHAHVADDDIILEGTTKMWVSRRDSLRDYQRWATDIMGDSSHVTEVVKVQ